MHVYVSTNNSSAVAEMGDCGWPQ